MTRKVLLFTFLLSTFGFTFTGCSKEGQFCDKMKELYGEDMDDCETDALPEIKKQCKDPEAVFSCVADADSKDEADKCYKEKCEKK